MQDALRKGRQCVELEADPPNPNPYTVDEALDFDSPPRDVLTWSRDTW